jgi:hypothetical protein
MKRVSKTLKKKHFKMIFLLLAFIFLIHSIQALEISDQFLFWIRMNILIFQKIAKKVLEIKFKKSNTLNVNLEAKYLEYDH